MINLTPEMVEWAETHHEIVSLMYTVHDAERVKHHPLVEGRFGWHLLSMSWAQEFQTINAGRVWDGEWIDEVYDFVKKKFDELESSYS